MKRAPVLLAVIFLLAAPGVSSAALREEWKDAGKEGKGKLHLFYDGKMLVKSETDVDGDGKPDIFMRYDGGVRNYAEEAHNHDGKIDRWYWYDDKGHLLRKWFDSNKDGKPDQFFFFPGGSHEICIKEYDRNYDGKVDRRLFTRWDGSRTVTTVIGTRVTHIPNPGYSVMQKEEDNNYDGTIDVSSDKEDKKRTRNGQKIDPNPTMSWQSPEEAQNASSKGPGTTSVEKRVKELNEKYGLE